MIKCRASLTWCLPPLNMPSSESSCPLLTAAGWQIKGGDGEDVDQTQKALGSRSAPAKPPPPSARPALRKRAITEAAETDEIYAHRYDNTSSRCTTKRTKSYVDEDDQASSVPSSPDLSTEEGPSVASQSGAVPGVDTGRTDEAG